MFATSKTILVVDDSMTGRSQVKKICKEMGYSSFLDADNGKSAMTQLENNKVDLILSDWNMPEMTRLELVEKGRATDNLKAIPFIMITAESKMSELMGVVKKGVNNYIQKLVTLEKLKEKMESTFKAA